MAPTSRLLAIAAISALAMGQPDSTITSAATKATATSSEDLIGSLWAGAESLLSSYYPSTSLTEVDTLTWPSSVVIGSSTIAVSPTSTSGMKTTTSPASSTSSSQASSQSSGSSSALQSANNAVETSGAASTTTPAAVASSTHHTDKRLGIALGVVLGLLAFAVLGVVVFCMHRRKKRTGTFLRHQPPLDDQEVESWRSPTNSSWQGNQSHIWADKYAPVAEHAPRSTRPAYMQQNTQGSSSAESGFYTPNESPAELSAVETRPATSERMMANGMPSRLSMPRRDRPSTPLIHDMMRSPVSPIASGNETRSHGYGHADSYPTTAPQNPFSSPEDNHTQGYDHPHHQREHSNPFYSPEDFHQSETPFLPARSPERRHSPQIHYPSGPELSSFDFGLARGQRDHANEDGEDGWRPQHTHGGRHEMA